MNEFVNFTKIISQITFVFNDKKYKQSEGLSMGNAFSPILSDIYMQYFEVKILNFINFKGRLSYLDDAFILFENPFDTSMSFKLQILFIPISSLRLS